MFNDGGADSREAVASPPKTTSGKLEQSGVNVRFINKIMHHKFMIVDGPRDEAARAKTAHLVTGSANWSSSAARTFDENTVFFQNQEELVFVQGGFLEVQPHRVTVLADTAIRANDLDEVKALEAKKKAEEAMANKDSSQNLAAAQAELSVALAQLEAIRKYRHRAG